MRYELKAQSLQHKAHICSCPIYWANSSLPDKSGNYITKAHSSQRTAHGQQCIICNLCFDKHNVTEQKTLQR